MWSNKRLIHLLALAFVVLAGTSGVAMADGIAHEWQVGLQNAASPVAEKVNGLHNLLIYIITGVTILVTVLLVYVMFRFNAKRNPEPSKRSHNTLLEVAWTVVPVLILVVVAIPSFKLLYYQDRATDADMTVKAIGHQWYWSYEYPDQGNFRFDSMMLTDDQLPEGGHRLLEVDNRIVVPAGKSIRLLVTSDDVLHSFAMPSMGVKLDAVPGRLNETWFMAEEPGTYYGQCSELCGVNHGFMPIVIEAVPESEFNAWVDEAQEKFARAGGGETVTLAQNTLR